MTLTTFTCTLIFHYYSECDKILFTCLIFELAMPVTFEFQERSLDMHVVRSDTSLLVCLPSAVSVPGQQRSHRVSDACTQKNPQLWSYLGYKTWISTGFLYIHKYQKRKEAVSLNYRYTAACKQY